MGKIIEERKPYSVKKGSTLYVLLPMTMRELEGITPKTILETIYDSDTKTFTVKVKIPLKR